jgi:hypothetical protein
MEEIYFYWIFLAYLIFTLTSTSFGINMLDQIPKQHYSTGTTTTTGTVTTGETKQDYTSTGTSPYSVNNPMYYNALILMSFSIAINALLIMYCIFKLYVLYTD